MTTGYIAQEIVEKHRKRPKKSSMSASIARAPFGKEYSKILPIPSIIGYVRMKSALIVSARDAFPRAFPKGVRSRVERVSRRL